MTNGKEAYAALLDSLEKARKWYKRGGSADKFKGYLQTVVGAEEFFRALGVGPDLLVTLTGLRNALFDAARRADRGKKSGSPRLANDIFAMASAAAAVTALKERDWSVSEAIKKVSGARKIDPKQLRSFRDNINRGLVDEFTVNVYKAYAARFSQPSLSEAELLLLLQDLPEIHP